MRKRCRISMLLIAALVLTVLTAPVIAQTGNPILDNMDERFDHTIQIVADGRITIDRELGHACTTGAVKRQTVRGFGELVKSESVRIAPHIISIEDEADWTTADDAVRNLSIVTTIDLCARSMSTADHAYANDDYDILEGEVIHRYHPLVVDGTVAVSSLSRQIWNVAISANPGETGSFSQDFRAAYGPGPYEEKFGEMDELGRVSFYDEKYLWWFDEDESDGIDRGDYYVGNYFEIDQYAYTSDGEMSRFISMSSPFTNTLFIEDMTVTGMAEVRESFEMDNLEGGPKAITLAWYELF